MLLPALVFSLLAAEPTSFPDAAALDKATARFAKVPIQVDLASLPENERKAAAKLVEASKLMDSLFLRQVWAGNETLLLDLLADTTPLGRARLQAFLINKGPWSRLDESRAFMPGVPAHKPPEANFYPAGATKEEVEKWLKTLRGSQRAAATGFFTTIRRDPKGKLIAVPYSLEYQGELALAARLLREAAALTAQPTLKKFLEARAAAFVGNDYYASDVAWMELDASLEPTIGPYEVYEDEWFNYKAAFEAYVTVRDDAETQKLAKFSSELQDIEDNLPIDPKYRNKKLGGMAPIRVVNSLFSSGDGRRGVMTAAFNLPNDEKVIKEKGSKRVMLKNIQQAKFDTVLVPISKVALRPADQASVQFEPFFTHILMHELVHGLGPHNIKVGKRATTVRQELKELSSAIEEAKADVAGLFALQRLVDRGVIDASMGKTMYVTFLASSFRTLRFGINEAHGKGMALQLNYLLDFGAFKVDPSGAFYVDDAKIKDGVVALSRELMTLQAEGNQARARELLTKLAVIRPEVKRILDQLLGVPVDIDPDFVTARELTR